MTLATTDLVWYRAESTSDSTPASNGGRLSEDTITSAVKNNLFSDLSASQRQAGADDWRKVGVGVRNADDLALVDPLISLWDVMAGDPYGLLWPGDFEDTQDDIAGTRPYGIGVLDAAVSAAATTLTLTVESSDYADMDPNPFQTGDRVRVDQRASWGDGENFEYRTITSVSYDGQTLTLGVDALEYDYSAGARVASVYEPDDLQTEVTDIAVTTSDSLAVDTDTYPITAPQIGCVDQTWTLTVTDGDSGALSVSGDTLGTIATGATGVDLSPSSDNGGTYFTVPADTWSGTAATGDTLVFTTRMAAAPVWEERITPAGAEAVSSSALTVLVEGSGE